MRVAYFTSLRNLEVRDEPRPELTEPTDVLLRIERLGVCGSDVHYYTEGGIGDQRLDYPATLGHECSATVVEVGPGVRGLQPGDRVAVDPALSCGHCDQCRAGRANTCRNLRFLGCPGEAPGAAADFHVLPAENCVPIPASMTLEEAALVEPLSIGLYAVRLASLRPGMRAAVFGCGPIGLSVMLCAKATADCKILATDLLDRRLEVAKACGADWTGNARSSDAQAAIARREPMGLDLVWECSGDPACVDQAQRLLAPGGTLVLVGIPGVRRVDFDIHVMRRKELTFKNVRRQRDCVGPAVNLVADRRIDVSPLLTHRFPMERMQEAFELVASYGDGVIKAVVDLSENRSDRA